MKKYFLTIFAILFIVTSSTFAQNYALSFNNDAEFDFESVDIDSIPAFSALTVELWVKINGDNTNYNIGLIDIDSENDYFFYLVGKRAAWVGNPEQCKTADTVEVDSWHHLALVLEKDTVKAMYIDGVSQGLDEPYSCTNPLKQTWKLGSLYDDATLALYGSMDELRIWNVVRTSQEINDNKDNELVGNEPGLVGYWNFNDGSGSKLTDLTSNNRDGVLNNMEASDWVSGAPVSEVVTQNKSLYFSGTAGNQKVVAPGFKDIVDSVYTQELWIKPDSFDDQKYNEFHLMQFFGGEHATQFYLVKINSDSAWVKTQDYNNSLEDGGVAVVINEWVHLAYVRDGGTDSTASLYVNGHLVSSVPIQESTVADSSLLLGLYNGYENGDVSYSGLMDEVRVWNKALTESEIQANMVQELNGDEEGLISYYDFNDQSGDVLEDRTGNGLNGTLYNMDSTNWNSENTPFTPPVVEPNKSLYFSGSAGNQSGIASGFKSLVDSVYTQELWIKPDAFSTSWGEAHVLQFVGDYHSQLYLRIKNVDTAWVYTQDGNASWENGTVVTLDKWTHLAYVRDGEDDSARIYINGVLSSTVVLDHEYPSTADSNLVLGLYNGYENGESSYSGLMDELRVWNKALTLEEIQADMVKELSGSEDGLVAYYDFNNQSGSVVKDRSPNGLDVQLKNMDASNWKKENTPFTPPVIPENDELIALWHFDEGTGTTVSDASGNEKDGLLKDGAVFSTGAVAGTAVKIEGQGYVLVPAGGSFSKITKKITIEAWVNPAYIDNDKSRHIVLAQWDGSANQRAYALIIEKFYNDVEAGSVRFMLSADGNGAEQIELHSKTKLEANAWSHIVVTSDGDSVRIFINGVQDSSVCAAPTGGIHVPTTDLYIGDWGWGDAPDNSEQYSGLIDEMALYNYALSADTILAHYNNTPTAVENNKVFPTIYALQQNYPNPFNPTTVISFALPKTSDVQLSVYNILGEKVTQLVNGKMVAGNYSVNFNATNLASGMYIYRIKAGDFVSVKKMMLLK